MALDAASGALLWATLTIDPDKPYTITGAPRVVNGKVLIGNSGADYGVRGMGWNSMVYNPELNLVYFGAGDGAPWNREQRSPSGF